MTVVIVKVYSREARRFGRQHQANDDRAHRGAARQKRSARRLLQRDPRGLRRAARLALSSFSRRQGRAGSGRARTCGKPAREVAEGFLSLWRSVLARSDFSAGCAVVAVTVAAESEDLRARAAEILRSWREKLVTLFVAGGIPKKKARSLAASLVAACEGGVILARAERSFEPFDLVAAEQLAMVEAAAKSAS